VNTHSSILQTHTARPLKQITARIKYQQEETLHLTELLLNFHFFHIFAQYYVYFNIRFEVQSSIVDNTAEETHAFSPESECAGCRQQGHANSKTLVGGVA